MDDRLSDLLLKCVRNNINFWYSQAVGLIEVFRISEDTTQFRERGYIADWDSETPEEAIDRLHDAVDNFISDGEVDE